MASSDLIQQIDDATQSITTNPAFSSEDNERLLASAKRLVKSLESDEEKAWKIIMSPTTKAALMAAIRMGVFDVFTEQEMTATEIAAKTGADAGLVVRLMRALLVNDIFEEIGDELYALNSLSRLFRDKDLHAFLPIVAYNDSRLVQLADFLESIEFKNPLEADKGLLQYVNKSPLPTMEWLKANPEELKIVSNGMVALTKNTRTHIRATLSSLFPLNLKSEVLIVDVGGGRGEALHDLRTARPDLEGGMIVQDLPEVIAGMKDTPGVEAMAHDFFTPQPIKGATAYLLCHVLHDWPTAPARKILTNLLPALTHPQACILILEQVLPTRDASVVNVSFDVTMMLFSGMERSEKQWAELLGSVGLRIESIIGEKGLKEMFGFQRIIKAVKK